MALTQVKIFPSIGIADWGGEQSGRVPRHGAATQLEAYRDRCRQQYASYFEGLTEPGRYSCPDLDTGRAAEGLDKCMVVQHKVLNLKVRNHKQ
jgi:hypothetical protein